MGKAKKINLGFGMLEIVVGVAIISIFLFAAMNAARTSVRLSSREIKNTKTSFLLEEGIEAVKLLRDESWDTNIASLNTGSDYYLNFDGSDWQSTTTNIFIDNLFERKFVLGDVYRDANEDIVDTGDLDSGTKKVTVYVSWSDGRATTTKNISTYITNLFE